VPAVGNAGIASKANRKMTLLERVLRFNHAAERFFRRHSKRPSAADYYRSRLDAAFEKAGTAVHLGAGGKDPATLTSVDLQGKTIYAVDPSEESLRRNPNPNKITAWGHDIPLPDASVDLVFSEYLMEHVEHPEETLAEARRLLRPGGRLLWVAPSLWSHTGLATHLTPLSFHKWVNRLLEPVQYRRASADVFPTFFRINSIPRIRRMLRETGFEIEDLYTVADAPHYTKLIPLVHQLVVLFHLVLDRFECLRYFRVVQVVTARKPATPEASRPPRTEETSQSP
jgi:ubiquinone/menaquinone biosynthesis C-methylase UbiE